MIINHYEIISIVSNCVFKISETNIGNTEQYEYMKKEMEKLRFENDRLQRRKDELDLIVEQCKLRDSIGITNGEREFKVSLASTLNL